MIECWQKARVAAAVARHLAAEALNALPESCVICGMQSDQNYALCSDCQEALPWLAGGCSSCGASAALSSSAGLCQACLRHSPSFDQCRSLFHYEGAIRLLISRFKYRGDMVAGRVLSKLMAAAVTSYYHSGSDQLGLAPVVVAMPLHRSRLGQRGFNQSRLLAAELARSLRVELRDSLLSRSRASTPQVELRSRARRVQNQKGSFRVAARVSSHLDCVLLVDDVVTTQSTLDAASRALKQAGITQVVCWTLARAALNS